MMILGYDGRRLTSVIYDFKSCGTYEYNYYFQQYGYDTAGEMYKATGTARNLSLNYENVLGNDLGEPTRYGYLWVRVPNDK